MHPDTQERLSAAIFIGCAIALLAGVGFVIIHYLGHGDLGNTVGVVWAFTWVLGYSAGAEVASPTTHDLE